MTPPADAWETKQLPDDFVELAADGTEIRPLAATSAATVVHCTLGAHQIDIPTRNVGIDEIWVILSGSGRLWRERVSDDVCDDVDVSAGRAITLPHDVKFQLRCDSDEPLRFICVTTPPWPGEHANVRIAEGKWTSTLPGAGAPVT